jgi:hypothetical protein
MRSALQAVLALCTLAMAVIAEMAPAAAYDYPWCVYGEELGFSGDCSYQTREQCLASSFGRSRTYCDVNRRLLFERQQPEQSKRRVRRQDY